MRFFLKLILSLMLIAFGSVGGFFAATKYRTQFDAMAAQIIVAGNAAPAERRIIYYRNPMGEPDISAMPKKDSMSMDYLPVFQKDLVPAQLSAPEKKSELTTGKKIRFYRNPMGLPDISPVPKKMA